MPLLPALQAFLEALDGSRTAPGRGAGPIREPVQQPQESLGKLMEAHGVRLAELEASVLGIKSYVKEEVDRGVRASEASRRAVQRVAQRVEGLAEGADPDGAEDVRGGDGGGSEARWVQPVPARVEVREPDRPTLDEYYAAARRGQVRN